MITACVGRRGLGKSTLAAFMVGQVTPRVILDPRAQFSGNVITTADPETILAALDDDKEIIIQPRNLERDTDETAAAVQTWLQEDKRRHCAVLIDEVGLLDLSAWDWLFRCSERKLVHFVLTFHRPVDLHTDMRAITDQLCLFRMTMPNDLREVQDLCGEDVRALVEDLDECEFVVYDLGRGTVKNVYRRAARNSWYVPLGAPRGVSAAVVNLPPVS